MAQLCEPFSQHPAEIVVIIVEDHDPLPCRAKLAEWMIACQEAVGRQDEGVIRNPNRAGVPPTDAVGPPACARSHQDVCEAVVQRIVGCDLALPEHLHVPVVAQLAETIVDDPAPGRQAGKACLADDPPTEFAGGLGEHHAVAPLAKCASSLQASRSGSHDQDTDVRLTVPDPIRVPSPAPFLAHRGVLRAANRRHCQITRDADVAAYALAYVIEAACLDLCPDE